MSLKTREVMLAGVETTYGKDPGLTAAANAIEVEDLNWAHESAKMIERPVVRPSLGKKQQVYGGSLKAISFKLAIKGSGTAGTAQDSSPILRACGLAETVTGGTSVVYKPASSSLESITVYYYEDGLLHKIHGAVANAATLELDAGGRLMLSVTLVGHMMSYGTAQSAGATTIVIAATESAVDDTFNGQSIEIIAGTGVGATKVAITDYTGSSKTVTVSAWPSGTPDNTSIYVIHGGPIDVALPAPTLDSTVPRAVTGLPITVGSYSPVVSKLSVDLGLQAAMPPAVGSPDGFGTIQITGRNITGSFDPEVALVAAKDWEAEWKAGTAAAVDTGTLGATAGNRWRLQLASIYPTEVSKGDRDNIGTREITFAGIESSGDDELTLTIT